MAPAFSPGTNGLVRAAVTDRRLWNFVEGCLHGAIAATGIRRNWSFSGSPSH